MASEFPGEKIASGRSRQDVLLRNARDRFVTVHTYGTYIVVLSLDHMGLGFCAAALMILYVLVLVVCHMTSI